MTTKLGKDKDVEVTYDDQQKINKFARVNTRLQDLKEELDKRKKALQNLEDAESELLMLDDESDSVHYFIGEVFVHCSFYDTNDMLEKEKQATEKEIQDLEKNCEKHKNILSDLKVQLYARFGSNINLEADED